MIPGTRWGALDIADIEEDDDKKQHEAQQYVDAVCAEIGAELANDPDALTHELPRLVSGALSRTGIVGEGLAKNAKNPELLWEQIVLRYLQMDSSERNYGLLSGFLNVLGKNQPELAAKILDQELDRKRLAGELVHWQMIVGFERGGFDRLLRMLEQDWLSSYAFRSMGHGRTHKALNSNQITEFLRALGKRTDNGVDCAIDVLNMRYYEYRSEQRPIPQDEKSIGRELLSKIQFRKSRDGAHDIATVARGCLEAPHDEPVARDICVNLRAALASYEAYGWHYQELVRFFATEFPEAVLDEFVEHSEISRGFRRDMFSTLRDEGACIFGNSDATKVLEWVNVAPATRASKLAQAIGYFTRADDKKTMEWTPLAIGLIEESQDPETVLNIFVERFQPNSWSGSRADIMESRVSLLQTLEKHSVAAIRDWAKKAISDFQKKVKAEREREAHRDRDRDERFE